MATNPRIQAAGVGKNSKRHDLDGTPGLSDSSLQYGDVQKLEAGQKTIQNTRTAQPTQAAAQGQQAPAVQPPDPIEFAKQRLGGGGTSVPQAELSRINTAQWLPLIERIATSGGASPLLRRAYVQMLQRLQAEPFAGSTAVVNKRELDSQVERAFG